MRGASRRRRPPRRGRRGASAAATLPVAAGQTCGAPGAARGGGRGHRGQLLVVDHHRFGAVARRAAGLGDHGGHRLADEAHHVHRQHRARRRGERRAVRALEGRRERSGLTPAAARSAPVSTAQHAGHGLGRASRRSTRCAHAHAASAGRPYGSGRAARGRRRRGRRRPAAARPRSAALPGRCRNGRSRHPCRLPRSCPRSLARSLCGPGGVRQAGGFFPAPSAAMLRLREGTST